MKHFNFKSFDYIDFDEYIIGRNGDYDILTEEYYFDIFEHPKFTYDRYIDYKHIIYESILKSYNTKELISKIKGVYDKYFTGNINIRHIESDSLNFMFTVTIPINICDTFIKKIKTLLTLYNYVISKRTDMLKSSILIIEPVKSDLKTDYIYNECKGILYYIVKQDAVNKILKLGIIPKKTKYRNGTPERIYFFTNINDTENIKNILPDNHYSLLKIDLTKAHNKIDFFTDTALDEYISVFTYEFIPRYCISKIKDL